MPEPSPGGPPRDLREILPELTRIVRRRRFMPHSYLVMAYVAVRYGMAISANLPGLARSYFRYLAALAVVMVGESVAVILASDSAYAWMPVIASAVWFLFSSLLCYSQLSLVKRKDGTHPASFGLSNALTLFRFLNIPMVVLLVPLFPTDRGLLLTGVTLFAAAVVSDTLDGNIARLTGTTTDFGRIYDPVCDIAINAGVCFGAWLAGYVPLWYLVLAQLRFFLPLFGGAWVYVYRKPWRIGPTLWGKLSVFVHAVFIGLVLLREVTGLPFLAQLSDKFLWLAGFLLTFNVVHIVDRGRIMVVGGNRQERQTDE